ncbi:tail fiber protein [Lysinibacillus parviboronicapiens]|uniref:tail fiber protein n=1 Tax=Lysinibacillus parviboronicapiens TaxID=436516 RepID=UPI001930F245|nr:tail fiber protein [Lysinibacillus parviboronicapiens]
MPNHTTNYNLIKPLPDEFYNVEDQNDNMEIIDAQMKAREETLTMHLDKDASLSQKGHVQLSNSTNSNSENLAATSKAVKQAIDFPQKFGLGAELIEVTSDFNTIVKSGFYHAKGENRPNNDALRSFFLLVNAISETSVLQIASPYQESDNIFYRSSDYTGWSKWKRIANSDDILFGNGSPEGVIIASVGTLYRDKVNGTLYSKKTGVGNTGWRALTWV